MEVIGTEQGLTGREKADILKGRLRRLFRQRRRVYAIAAREVTEAGLALSPAAVDAGEVPCALGSCTAEQQRMLTLWLGERGLAKAEIARDLGVSEANVKREIAAAFDRMVAMIWDE